MKTITICGSLRFTKEMIRIAEELELKQWYCVIQCTYNFKNVDYTETEMNILDKLQKEKIDLCNAIYVVNIGGHTGALTDRNIEYAKQHGKEIIYHEPLKAEPTNN